MSEDIEEGNFQNYNFYVVGIKWNLYDNNKDIDYYSEILESFELATFTGSWDPLDQVDLHNVESLNEKPISKPEALSFWEKFFRFFFR